MLGELAIGNLDQLEMLFGLEALDLIVSEAIRMPSLGGNLVGLADRDFGRACLCKTKRLAVLDALFADTGHCALTAQAVEIARNLSSNIRASSSCFFKPSTICAGALAKNHRYPIGARSCQDLFILRDLFGQALSRSAATSTVRS